MTRIHIGCPCFFSVKEHPRFTLVLARKRVAIVLSVLDNFLVGKRRLVKGVGRNRKNDETLGRIFAEFMSQLTHVGGGQSSKVGSGGRHSWLLQIQS
jgi:hypothetical protein